MIRGYFNNYWTSTETYEALKVYIKMNQYNLHDKVIQMISGGKVKINLTKFQNDMTTLQQFHFKLIIATYRKPIGNIFSCNSKKRFLLLFFFLFCL